MARQEVTYRQFQNQGEASILPHDEHYESENAYPDERAPCRGESGWYQELQ